VRIPEKITKAWLDQKGYKLVQVFDRGFRIALLTKTGNKWAHLKLIDGSGKNIKMKVDKLADANPVVREKGKWVVRSVA
jgi:hypothetical protein|tara:strand:+ start:723 stop:959 length:237 start_codon:yes stop_codon:yes gene_type:complete